MSANRIAFVLGVIAVTLGLLWISWPKKTSRMASEVGRSEVMREGKAAGLVDVKVCAVDETWSGLKFVIPVADRSGG